jgi:ubiquinone/menaquinone biosynthesis C-methylase UbiE
MPPDLLTLPAVEYRNGFARSLEVRSAPQIAACYVYLSLKQMHRMVRLAVRHLGVKPFRGVGLEAGAGCGLLSSIVARDPAVEKVFAIEICEEMCRRIIPKMANWVLGAAAHKVIPVWGSFDDVELPDNSVDFIVEIDSLHHADDLEQTLRECARVLKPGSQMLCFDRCHPDTVTDEQVDEMLSVVYSEDFLRKNCYPPGVRLTRRDNGEHEYRFFEWKRAFDRSGLELIAVRRFVEHVRFTLAVKGVLGVLPHGLRHRLYRSDNGSFETTLRWLTSVLTPASLCDFGRVIRAPRNSTVFLLVKK